MSIKSITAAIAFAVLAVDYGMAQGDIQGAVVVPATVGAADSIAATDSMNNVRQKKKHSWLRRVIRGFSKVDTNYIEPQKYNFTAMLQNTTSFEGYTLRNVNGESVRFAPRPSYKLGPYIGWRWVFLGYTIDLRHMSGNARQGFDFSLYAPQVGIDMFYRKSGDNYRIDRVNFHNGFNNRAMRHVDFDGFESNEGGFNAYYIFNHNKFSYPAAYSQSTVQRRSAGSALAGFGYTRHSLSVDWESFFKLMDERMGDGTAAAVTDTTLRSADVKYRDISLSGGYAYNWVFAKNWLLDVSLQLALGYKQSSSDINNERVTKFREFDFHNFNIDGVARTGLVWNNMRWYFGASAIFHTYNYRRKQFTSNTTFGNVNIYLGYNFGLKSQYKNKKKR